MFSSTAAQTNESDAQQVIPVAGTLSNLCVLLNKAPQNGAGNQQIVFTVFKNGVATGVTCTIAENATNATDITHTVSFAVGDTITLESDPTGSTTNNPATNIFVRWGAKYAP